jgi:hypothetical protein
MEKLRIRPEDRERVPDVYQLYKRSAEGKVNWLPVRISAEEVDGCRPFVDHLLDRLKCNIAPIIFKDKQNGDTRTY